MAPVGREKAAQRLARAIEDGRKAQDRGQGVSGVQELVREAQAAYDAGDYPKSVVYSDMLHAMLRLAQSSPETAPGRLRIEQQHWSVVGMERGHRMFLIGIALGVVGLLIDIGAIATLNPANPFGNLNII